VIAVAADAAPVGRPRLQRLRSEGHY
jgi:hypothetical protein